MAQPTVSVVLVNWNRRDQLERCLRSLFEHTRYGPLEVVVVDNGSTDGSPETVRDQFPTIRLVENARNEGAGRARNQGAQIATGELLVLMDCDTYVTDDLIGNAARYLLVDRPDVAMVGCELRLPDGRRQHSAFRAMTIRHSLFEHLWLYRLLPKDRRAHVLLNGYWEEGETEADWLVATFLALRRDVFMASGGFNVDLFPEDSEFGIRLHRAGHKIVYAPQIGVLRHDPAPMDEGKLRLYHHAGLKAYATLNGRLLARLYRLSQLLGVTVRWAVYRTASLIRPSDYRRSQHELYRSLIGIYLEPCRD
jgi:GT2 family glycosyltransferase